MSVLIAGTLVEIKRMSRRIKSVKTPTLDPNLPIDEQEDSILVDIEAHLMVF